MNSFNDLQRNVDALSILDRVVERGSEGWIEDPYSIYTAVEQAAHVLRGMSIEEVERTVRHPSMTTHSYSHRSRRDNR